MPTPRLRLGQLLVDARLISAAALEEVLAAQRTDGRRLGTLLVERGLINETQLTQILSHQLSVPWVSLLHIEFSRQLLNLVPHDVADRYCLVPIYVRHVRNQGDTLYVAMDDPSNEDGLKACREHSGLPVRSMIAPPADIRSAIRVYYGVGPASGAAPAADRPRQRPPLLRQRRPPEPAPAAGALRAEARRAPPQAEADAPATQREPAIRSTPADPPRVDAVGPSPDPPVPADAPAQAPVAAEVLATASSVDEPASPPAPLDGEPPPARHDPAAEGPTIEAVEISVDPARVERLRGLLDASPTPPPPSSPEVENIPRPKGRAPRMVALTLLDGTTITLPAKRRARGAAPRSTRPTRPTRAPRRASPPRRRRPR